MKLLLSRFGTAGLLLMVLGSSARTEPLTRIAITRLGKPPTALVEMPGKQEYGTAFCVHASGLFVTNEHVVRKAGSTGTITLVLNTGRKEQKVLKAKVVRVDSERDLAIVQAIGKHDLPTLSLGSDEDLEETIELVAFGYPFGTSLSVTKGEYPAITVSTGRITALRRKKGDLHRIQMDGSLNPGNSGGPVLDSNGKVVGVVVSGVRGSGVAMAIPVSHLNKMIQQPVIKFNIPKIDESNQSRPVLFEATAASFLPSTKPISLELAIAEVGNTTRRFPMKLEDGVYRVKAIPKTGKSGPVRMKAAIKFADGAVMGEIDDQSFQLGDETYRLEKVRRIQFGKTPNASLWSGKTVNGETLDLKELSLNVGGQVFQVKLDKATELTLSTPKGPIPVSCTIIATQDKKEIGRITRRLGELIIAGFKMPEKSSDSVSYLRAISPKGDYIGQGKTYFYPGGEKMRIRPIRGGVSISVGGWSAQFGAPRGQELKAGFYENAIRYPFHDGNPGLSFSGQGRGCNKLTGKFVVWELSIKEGVLTRLAIDFEQRCEGRGKPLVGQIRFNSTYR